jgi:hypothetical protein
MENKNLKPFPVLIENNKINFSFLGGLDTYINERFRFKIQLVELYSYINFNMLKRMEKHPIILGKGNWIFLSSTGCLQDFLKIRRFTAEEMKRFYRQIAARSDWCNANGIKLIILIAPDKHNVYPELFPFEQTAGQNLTETLLDSMPESLQSIKDTIIYPADYLVSKKKEYPYPLFFETDMHWNQGGAFLAYKLLEEKVKNYFPDTVFPQIEYTTTTGIGPAGDLLRYCPSLKYSTTQVDITPKIINGGEEIRQTLPRTVLIHDSFFWALSPFTDNLLNVVKTYTIAEGSFRSDYREEILALEPDIIVWEFVEKGMSIVSDDLSWD